MRNIWTIALREYKYYFASPIAYVLALFVFLVVGALFAASIIYTLQTFGQVPPPGVQVVTGPLMFMLVFVCPALTMRLLSEEQRLGTMELLLTAPVRDWELVVGKWLGSFLFVFTLVAVTFVYPVVLNMLVDPGIDQGPIVTSYVGVLLVSATFLSIGVAVSSLFSNQVVSFIATFILLIFFWWMLGIFVQVSGPTGAEVLRYLDFSSHFYNKLMVGVIELGNIVYLVSLTALALFLGSVSVEMRRWR
jgi:ABC-2 type transport system permease protein